MQVTTRIWFRNPDLSEFSSILPQRSTELLLPTGENLSGCAPSASTVDEPQSGEDEQREHIQEFLASLPHFSTMATQWNHFNRSSS